MPKTKRFVGATASTAVISADYSSGGCSNAGTNLFSGGKPPKSCPKLKPWLSKPQREKQKQEKPAVKKCCDFKGAVSTYSLGKSYEPSGNDCDDCSSVSASEHGTCTWSEVRNCSKKSTECSSGTGSDPGSSKSGSGSSGTSGSSGSCSSSWSSSSECSSSSSDSSSSSSSCSSSSSSSSSCSSSSSSSGCSSNSSSSSICEDKVFIVTLVEKKMHPWAGRICDTYKAFAINGVPGKTLRLKRGRTYKFQILVDLKVDCEQPFYITEDPAGGMKGDMCEATHDPVEIMGTPKPVKEGIFILKITDKFPKHAYYQSRASKFLGGRIVIKG